MKPKLIVKSLAELPANALEIAASLPARAAHTTRREMIGARDRSAAVVRAILERANSPLRSLARIQGWNRGGLNEWRP